MAKFKAGDMIIAELDMSDGTTELKVFMVNRIIIEENKYSLYIGQEFYSLDNGDGWIDSRSLCRSIDENFQLCD